MRPAQRIEARGPGVLLRGGSERRFEVGSQAEEFVFPPAEGMIVGESSPTRKQCRLQSGGRGQLADAPSLGRHPLQSQRYVIVLAHHDSSARTRYKIGPIIESLHSPCMEARLRIVPRTNIVGAPAGVTHISALVGRVKQKLAPRGELLAAHKRPPCDSTMERLIRRPMPVP